MAHNDFYHFKKVYIQIENQPRIREFRPLLFKFGHFNDQILSIFSHSYTFAGEPCTTVDGKSHAQNVVTSRLRCRRCFFCRGEKSANAIMLLKLQTRQGALSEKTLNFKSISQKVIYIAYIKYFTTKFVCAFVLGWSFEN